MRGLLGLDTRHVEDTRFQQAPAAEQGSEKVCAQPFQHGAGDDLRKVGLLKGTKSREA